MDVKEVFKNYKLNNVKFIKDNINDLFLRKFPLNSLKGELEESDEFCNLLDISDWLISNGIDILEKDENGNNGLINSILLKNYSYFYLFINKGIDVTVKSSDGISPLMLALSKDYYSEYMVKTLINLGADLNVRDMINGCLYSPLLLAAVNNNTDMFRYLLQHGAKVNLQRDLLNQFEDSDEITKILNEFDNDLYDLITYWYENYDPLKFPNLLEFLEKTRNRDLTSLELEIFGELGKRIKNMDYNNEIYKFIYNKEIEFFKEYLKNKKNSINNLPLYIMEDDFAFFSIVNAGSILDVKTKKKKIEFDEDGNVLEYVYAYGINNKDIIHRLKREDFDKCKNALFNSLIRYNIDYNKMGISYTKDEILLNIKEISRGILYTNDDQILNDDDIIMVLMDTISDYIELFDEEDIIFKKYLYFCLRRNAYFIKRLSLSYRGNMDIFLFIARHCSNDYALRFATEKLKKNEEYRKQLNEIHDSFLYYTETRDERKNKIAEYEYEKEQMVKEVFERVEREPSYYKLVCDKYFRSRRLALLAIKGDASNILNVSTAFRNNLDFINEARLLNPDIDNYFNKEDDSEMNSDVKRKIIDIIRDYSEKNYMFPIAIRDFTSIYRNYPSTILELINEGREDIVLDKFGDIGRYFIKYYDKFDDDIFFEMYFADISHDASCRVRIPPEKTHIAVRLLNDRNVIKKMMLVNGGELDRYRKEFREDKEIVMAAVSSNWHATKYTSRELQNDKDVILQALQTKFRCSDIYIGKSLKDDKDILSLIDKLNKREKKSIIWV